MASAHTFPTAPDAVLTEVQSYQDAHPEIAHADYGWHGWRNAYRVIVVVDGDEYEGRGHTIEWAHRVAQSKADRARNAARLVAASRGMRLPGDGGFAYRASTGEFVEWGA